MLIGALLSEEGFVETPAPVGDEGRGGRPPGEISVPGETNGAAVVVEGSATVLVRECEGVLGGRRVEVFELVFVGGGVTVIVFVWVGGGVRLSDLVSVMVIVVVRVEVSVLVGGCVRLADFVAVVDSDSEEVGDCVAVFELVSVFVAAVEIVSDGDGVLSGGGVMVCVLVGVGGSVLVLVFVAVTDVDGVAVLVADFVKLFVLVCCAVRLQVVAVADSVEVFVPHDELTEAVTVTSGVPECVGVGVRLLNTTIFPGVDPSATNNSVPPVATIISNAAFSPALATAATTYPLSALSGAIFKILRGLSFVAKYPTSNPGTITIPRIFVAALPEKVKVPTSTIEAIKILMSTGGFGV